MKFTKRHILPFLLSALCLCLTVLPGGAASATGTTAKEFTDVASNHKYYQAIMYCAEQGFVNGVTPTSFAPDEALTREQMALIWARTFHVGKPHTFTDVPSVVKNEADQSIIVMNALGFFYGTAENEFGRRSHITREQLATVASRTYLPGVDTGDTLTYEDANKIANWAKNAVTDCAHYGLLDGIVANNKFLPQNPMTRGEVCQLIKNVMDYRMGQNNETPTPTPSPVTQYTVIYNANGGTGANVTETVDEGTEVTVKTAAAAGFTHADKVFAGWNTAADGNGTAHAAGGKLTVTGNVTLYAVWEDETLSQ